MAWLRYKIILILLLVSLGASKVFAAGITINSGASITFSGSPEITTKDLSVGGILSAAAGTVNLDGTWTRTGTFIPGTSTVGVVGSGASAITGSNTFYNFSSAAASKTINFTAGATQTVTNNFSLDGGSSAGRITLRSTAAGTQWNINPQGARSINYTDVRDSNNINSTVVSLSNSVDAGNNTNWVFGTLAFASNPRVITANEEAGPFIVEVQFSNGNSASADIVVNLASNSTGTYQFRATSGGQAVTSVTIPAGSASATFFYIDSVSGTPTITVSANGYTSASQQQTALAGIFAVSVTTPQVAGSNFTMTITAKDDSGNTVTSFSGTVNLSVNYVSPSTGSGALGVTSTSSFTNGVATISTQTFSDCGTITITATDSSDSTRSGASANIDFRPFDFSLGLSALDASASAGTDARHTVAKPFTLAVTARNASGATCPNYKGSANLTVTNVSPSENQAGVLSTTALDSTLWTGGISNLTTQAYDKWGVIKIKATDAVITTSSGTSANINFVPKDFSITLSEPPASRTFYYTNEEFSATVAARDFNDSTIANYQGEVSFSGSGLTLPLNYTFVSNDSGNHKFEQISGSSERTANIKVTDTKVTSVTGTSADIVLKAATIEVISTSGPVGPVNVQVRIIDSNGDIITEDSSTQFLITLTEFVTDNNSAVSTAAGTRVTVENGIANVVISDTEAETVSIGIASANPKIPAKAGVVRFGTVSGGGVGIELWREVQPPPGEEEGEEEGKR
ncbi:MAG: hypothetical protein HY350_02575 [Candidatus Omnitrophica bacterium]|nr:hypothetical protein [Candidatus Omnitrophota bacterium]